MRCPYCQSDQLKVTDTRESQDGLATRRRRECSACKKRFTTFETVELQVLQVQKRNGRFQDYEFSKLLQGIQQAAKHTRLSPDDVLTMAINLQSQLLTSIQESITTKEIGDRVMNSLRELDSIAYIRFACEYRRFNDIKELIKAIDAIEPKDKQQ